MGRKLEKYISGGEIVMKTLSEKGVQIGFGLVGNPISPMLVYASKYEIKIISVRHELNAIHMADGWAQKSKKPGVVFVTAGPGFTNTYSGIIKAHKAGTPLVIITASISQISRDCGALQELEELDTIKRYSIKLQIFVHNDSSWGICKSAQRLLYLTEESVDIRDTRYELISEAFGHKGLLINTIDELHNALSDTRALKETICYNLIMDTNEYSPGAIKYNEVLKIK